jgi:hypothetical protein
MLTALCLVEATGSKEIKPPAQPQWTPLNRTSSSYVSLAQSWTSVCTDIYTHRPPIRAWLWFDELSKKFKSPLIYLNLAGQDLIVINDYQTAVELVRRFMTRINSRK